MSKANDHQPGRKRRGEKGQTIVIIAFASIALFAMIGLAIDAGRLYVTRAELSRSVDAAALSGILEFNGTTDGLANGEAKAEDYFYENEGVGNTTLSIVSDGAENEMTVDATKTVELIFMRVLGIETATVSAHAKAGFGTQFLDAVMVLDTTPSMAGNPIQQAALAADSFKDILLGDSPDGNVAIGLTAFRGCFRPSPLSRTDCVLTSGSDRWVENLSSSNSTLDSILSNIQTASGGGSVGTNVCTGLAMGWNIISGTGNHNDDILYPDNQQFLILLSDGDNYYPGNNTYQDPYYTSGAYNSSSSPTGTTVGATVYPCQPIDDSGSSNGSPCPSPWNSPSISSTYPCYKGVFSPVTEIAQDNFDGSGSSCPTNWTTTGSGSGAWVGAWVISSSPAPSAIGNTSSANDTSCHIRLRGTASICRAVDLSSVPGATLRYSALEDSWEGSETTYVEVSSNSNACSAGTGFNTIETITDSEIGGSYNDFSESLDSYVGQVVYIRFRGNMDSASYDGIYLDTIQVQGGSTGSSSGYLNGSDNSSPTNCNVQQKPRERQLDVRTLALANAIKAQGVEIYVVAFAGGVANCYLDPEVTGVNFDSNNTSNCGLITDNAAYPVGASGPDGSTDPTWPNPNYRLLQCISSSIDGDHYFYAADADELQGIFTTIATQIAHRLIE